MFIHAKNIKKALLLNLPGAISHKKMLSPNRVLKVTPAEKDHVKQSSVLLLLFIENNELIACLIKRPSHMKHHAGQVALPGGRIEKGETAIETALRETFEEIGVKSNDIEILGLLSEFYVEVSKFQINPFVGWLQKRPKFKIDHNEVEKTILFPINRFKAPFSEVELDTVSGKLKVPCIKFDEEIIWGATAMILAEFSDILEQFNFTSE
ncbi:MAG: CoA pyrophosphatase [Draconibacterium sp.]|nr:CoA pyrophosphatase [Draconibacterium sp.]